MKVLPTLNVKGLPQHGFWTAAPIWWGTLLLTVIESMVFLLTIASYYYLHLNFKDWPPAHIAEPNIVLGTANLVVIVLSTFPFWKMQKCAEQDRPKELKLWLAVGILFGAAATALRAFEFQGMNCHWDSNAYGSIVWVMLGLHLFHMGITTCETILLLIWSVMKGLDAKHRVDIEVNSLYWYFVVISWVVLYGVIYITPYVL